MCIGEDQGISMLVKNVNK